MKIKIKKSGHMGVTFYAPIGLVKFLLRDGIVRFAIRHADEKEKRYIKAIDYKELREALDSLREYKGLNVVDVRSADGHVVQIII